MPSTVGILSAAGFLKNPVEALSLGYRVNYIVNPSFEVDASNWVTLAGATLTRVTSESIFGSAALQVDSVGGGGIQTANRVPFLAGQGDYQISAYVKLEEGATEANYFLRYLQYETLEASGTVAAANVGIQSLTVTGNWVRLSGVMPRSATANYFHLRVVTGSTTPGETYYIDSVMVEKSSTLKPYFDGSQGGFWTGTPHGSYSGANPY